jgi:serine/threonine protein kinase
MNLNKKTNLKSKLLSQGGFGCIYYPGLKCNGKPQNNKNVVSKLQKKDDSSDNEIKIGKIIMGIDNYKLYFLPVISSCPVNLSIFNKELLSECNILPNSKSLNKKVSNTQGYNDNDNDDSYILMEIPYVKNKSFYAILIDMYSSKKHVIVGLIENYSYLLDSINILLKKNIVHFDIKSENILYNQNTHLPVLIDFGVSIDMSTFNYKNISTYFYTYSPDYYIWPLEVHVITFLLYETTESSLTEKDITSICMEYVKYNKGLINFSNGFKGNYLKACQDYLQMYVGMDKKKTIELLVAFYPSWDNYSLSILYLKTFSFMFPHGFHKNSLILYFSQLLLYNIQPNPSKRYSLEETIQKFKDIFFIEEQVDNYIDLINTFEYDVGHTTKAIQADLDQLGKTKAMVQKYI